MPKVYIAAAFRSLSARNDSNKAYGAILDEQYTAFLETIEDIFLERGFHTCLPHRDEGQWGHVYYAPTAIGALCFRHVATSDYVFAIAEKGRGVHLELGYAAAMPGKKLILAYAKDTEPSTLLSGLQTHEDRWRFSSTGRQNTTILEYSTREELFRRLRDLLDREGHAAQPRADLHRRRTTLIDLGSHTIKLRIYSHSFGTRPRVIREERRSVGLMGGVLANGSIGTDAIESVIALLRAWCDRSVFEGSDRVIVTGTAALRKANDVESLRERLRRDLSVELRVLAPPDELACIYDAVLSTFGQGTEAAVLNLGGGSTQIGVGTATERLASHMVPVGTRVIADRWPWKGPLSTKTQAEILDFVAETLRIYVPRPVPSSRLVHTGGEVDFLLRCRVPMVVCGDSPIHVSAVSVADFAAFAEEFAGSDPAILAEEFGLDPAWAAGSVASNAIALCAARALGSKTIIPSNLNISDGLLMAAAV